MARPSDHLWASVIESGRTADAAAIVDAWVGELLTGNSASSAFAHVVQALSDASYLVLTYGSAELDASNWLDAARRLEVWRSKLGG